MATLANPGTRVPTFTYAALTRRGSDYVLVSSSAGAWRFMGAGGTRSAPFGAIISYYCYWG